MAGLGFKDFAVGEVLTSADVDGYLMQQTVMRFADSGARGSALGTAAGTGVPLAEGMLSYLQDTDAVEVYDGSVWRRPGLFRKIVSTVKTDTFTLATSTSTPFTDVTGMSVTITPTSNTSKVLILVDAQFGRSAEPLNYRLNGGNADDYVGDTASNRILATGQSTPGTSALNNVAVVYLDSPATISPVTYALQVRSGGVSAGTIYVNRASDDADNANRTRGASSITAIEVSA